MAFYFYGKSLTSKEGHPFIVLETTPKTDKTPCLAGNTYTLALPRAVEEKLPFTLTTGVCYVANADEWWLDTREGKPSNLLHGKNLTLREYVPNTNIALEIPDSDIDIKGGE